MALSKEREAELRRWHTNLGVAVNEWGDGGKPYEGITKAEVYELLGEALAPTEDTMLAMTNEESSVLIAELTIALADSLAEKLKPCIPPCAGHLGEKSSKLLTAALAKHNNLTDALLRVWEAVGLTYEEAKALKVDEDVTVTLTGPEVELIAGLVATPAVEDVVAPGLTARGL